ncbi:hypothetical protein JKP88DRAFT_158439 [Tribonema minus]|uniref:RING-type domain-containing protein n=1 Tax=Tribonema minus TaxID=303371 RepID=A0A835YNP2_9STRA|nr:hypothetical protein JKP88DRAFT_158439 [Tribonema minus]
MLSAVALTDCAICLAAFEGGDALRRLRCGHAFHGACLQPWVDHHSDCPLCKACIRGGKGEPAVGGGASAPPPLPPAQQQQQQVPARQSQGVASWLIGRRVFWRARNGRVQTQAAPW